MKTINNQDPKSNMIDVDTKKLLTGIKFLVISFLLSSCFLTSAQAQTKVKSKPSDSTFSFVYVTDIHLDYKNNSVQYFDKAITKINNLKPEFIVTGGDNIMDAGYPSESRADSLYELYKSEIKRFNMPVHTGIGNHESFGVNNPKISPENPMYGKKMYESKLGKRYYTFSNKGWKFFMLDDIMETGTRGQYSACIDDEQMGWLKKELAATDSLTPIVICSHIPYFSSLPSMKIIKSGPLEKSRDNDGISNSLEFFKLFAHHNLKLVLQGHIHFFEVLYANGITYVSGAPLTGAIWRTLTKENGLCLFTIKGDDLTWKFIENKL